MRRRFGLMALVAVVSVSVLYLSYPRLIASVRYLPVDRALDRYYADNLIPTDRLTVLIRFANEAIGRNDHYRYRDGLSQLHYLRALDVQTPAKERRTAYRSAEAEAMESLRLAPAQAAVWLRMATIRWILHDEPESIIEPWKMSVFTGRTYTTLYTLRVEIGLAVHEQLADEGRAMLRDQVRLAWRLHPGGLMQVLSRRDPGLRLMRNLLAGADPLIITDMEAWIEKLP